VDHFEKAVQVSEVFSQNEVIDVIGITKGKGFKGKQHFQIIWLVKTIPKVLHFDGVQRSYQGRHTKG